MSARTLLLTCAVLAAPALAWAAPPSSAPQAGPAGAAASLPEVRPLNVATRVTPERVRLGEPFVYEVAITHLKEQRFDVQLPEEELGAFGLLGQERHREDGQDASTTTFRLKLALYELGKRKLPDLTFQVAGPGGEGRYVARGPQVEGLSSLPPGADPRAEKLLDIQAPVGLQVRTFRALLGLAGLAALAALALLLGRRLLGRTWRRRPPLALHDRVRAALDALGRQDLPGQGREREFYFQLSDLVRGYLGERYGFEALECTSAELLERLRRRDTPGLPLPELTAFLSEADLVKFARAPADPAACRGALAFGYRLLELTPLPVPQPLEAHAALS